MTRRPIISSGTVLGIGMGGFIDGILFHQILQVHNMVSAKVPPRESIQNMEINMYWDGMFHLITWIVTAIGLGMLWRAGKRTDVIWSGKAFYGGLLFGWGLFNLVEGLVNHHWLHMHHVYEYGPHLGFDLAFLASGVIMIAAGLLIIRSARNEKMQFGAVGVG